MCLHRIGDAVDQVLGRRVEVELLEIVELAIELRRDSLPKAELNGASEVQYLLGLDVTAVERMFTGDWSKPWSKPGSA